MGTAPPYLDSRLHRHWRRHDRHQVSSLVFLGRDLQTPSSNLQTQLSARGIALLPRCAREARICPEPIGLRGLQAEDSLFWTRDCQLQRCCVRRGARAVFGVSVEMRSTRFQPHLQPEFPPRSQRSQRSRWLAGNQGCSKSLIHRESTGHHAIVRHPGLPLFNSSPANHIPARPGPC
ncbi:hypothetical protein BDZ85DRAFT_137161 [Elsinoe ampelina]|uniref:Uncharacterized protein n=1 Tax=Elsinoe ampelina TaxID=302913 RepID=A0A6A6G8U4_9PEZI|nr:hypothetical protein BDZ85DRAFT_137161 [Elsinoe ampelina]